MNINILQANNPYMRAGGVNVKKISQPNNISKPNEVQAKQNITTVQDKNSISSNTSTQNVLSQSEIKYFEKLFPESSMQLQKHVLFNRNGKINEIDVNKGSLFDIKA